MSATPRTGVRLFATSPRLPSLCLLRRGSHLNPKRKPSYLHQSQAPGRRAREVLLSGLRTKKLNRLGLRQGFPGIRRRGRKITLLPTTRQRNMSSRSPASLRLRSTLEHGRYRASWRRCLNELARNGASSSFVTFPRRLHCKAVSRMYSKTLCLSTMVLSCWTFIQMAHLCAEGT